MPHKLLNLDNAALFLTITPKDLRAMAMAGEIPCCWQGERLMFEQAELDIWLSHQMVLQRNDTKSFTRQTHADTEVILADYLTPETVTDALPGKTRTAILKNLVGLAENSGLLYNPDDLFEQIKLREEHASTAMDNGIALVHPAERQEFMFEAPFLCLARAEHPIFFGEINGIPTDLFFLVACEDSNLHVKMLGKICLLCAETPLLSELRQAESPEKMLESLVTIEQKFHI